MMSPAGQRGATLLEFVLATSISAVVVIGLVALLFHEFRGSAIANTAITAAQEISNAARLLNEDGMMAESTSLVQGAPPVDSLTLTWSDQSGFADLSYHASYYLDGTDLLRDRGDGSVMLVARNISGIEFSQDGNMLTVSISCTPDWGTERTVRKTYRVYLRPGGQG